MIMQLIRLLKDWTLPVAIGTGCVVYIIFALVPQLDNFATCRTRVRRYASDVYVPRAIRHVLQGRLS